eukprot:CAMPEP_0118639820 /NCGR_PEP_ID=MMETSP0785-20121206/4426_1 /TAXON_ID=91992 /ORGANISM="Bolidomonas pacifica, Strain CCMP 1866" /LENGTH=32 /DNA_ID= /DNA_START= /DNA_END= /DNA_ORIENTATION=
MYIGGTYPTSTTDAVTTANYRDLSVKVILSSP